jgi:hypothetical protein
MRKFAVILIILFASFAYAENCFEAVSEENLTNYCLIRKINSKALSPVYLYAVDLRLKRAGYLSGLGVGKKGENYYFASQYSVGIYKEKNLNGGNPKGELILQNLIYRGDVEKEMRSDTVVSPVFDLTSRMIYGEGRYINLSFTASEAIGIKSNLRNSVHKYNLCFDNHLVRWNYFKICVSEVDDRKLLQNEKISNQEVGYLKVMEVSDVLFSLRLFGVNNKINYLRQNRIKYGASILTDYGFTTLDVTYGRSKEGFLLLKRQLDLTHTKFLFGKRVTFGYTRRDADGGALLGVQYGEQATSKFINVGLHENWLISVSSVKNNSNVNYFNYKDEGISLRYLKSIN